MEDQAVNVVVREEEEEEEVEEFCSCCEDEDLEAWKETEEPVGVEGLKDELDEFSVRLFFKGVSIAK
ncbi:hypothetical protein ACUX4R_27875, partial [Salmonella enterica]